MTDKDVLAALGAILAAFFIIAMLILVIGIIIMVIMTICQWILFKKAGEPGWASLIPIYNFFVMSKISFGDYRWAFLWLGTYVVYFALTMIRSVFTAFSDSDFAMIIVLMISIVSVIVSLAMTAISCINLFHFGKAFGKSTGFCVLLLFFSPICLIFMAASKNTQYVGYSDFGKEMFEKIKAKF